MSKPSNSFTTIFTALYLIFLSSCSASFYAEEGSKTYERETLLLHIVRFSGESPSLIAEWYTGDPSRWEDAKSYNGHIIPESLQVGQKLRIPERFVSNFKNLPESFVQMSKSRKALPEEVSQVTAESMPEAVENESEGTEGGLERDRERLLEQVIRD